MSPAATVLRRLIKTTLLVGVPFSLLGVLMGWGTHPGGGLIFIVALVPSALLITREVIPRELFWFAFPFVQFIYYFLCVSVILGISALLKRKPRAA
jgi:hypothetical protein